jgi:hypothetical protein
MKEGAENMQSKIQAKVESVVKNINETGKGRISMGQAELFNMAIKIYFFHF